MTKLSFVPLLIALGLQGCAGNTSYVVDQIINTPLSLKSIKNTATAYNNSVPQNMYEGGFWDVRETTAVYDFIDPPKNLDELEKKYEQNNATADEKFELAYFYVNKWLFSKYKYKDIICKQYMPCPPATPLSLMKINTRARPILNELIQANHQEALLFAGQIELSVGNYKNAVSYLSKASSQGDQDASNLLAALYSGANLYDSYSNRLSLIFPRTEKLLNLKKANELCTRNTKPSINTYFYNISIARNASSCSFNASVPGDRPGMMMRSIYAYQVDSLNKMIAERKRNQEIAEANRIKEEERRKAEAERQLAKQKEDELERARLRQQKIAEYNQWCKSNPKACREKELAQQREEIKYQQEMQERQHLQQECFVEAGAEGITPWMCPMF
ncbi:CCDC34 family protein [Pseudogulbenkiania subflava]|nr:hypothetical protein [Pseudogulbenkiania subflava]